MPDDEPALKVTLKDVYTDMQEMKTLLQSVAAQLPSHIQQTEKDLVDIRKDTSDHERRIRGLETRMWAAVGAFGLIAAASPYISKLIS